MVMDHAESEVAEFYRDQSVFVTGATGFMGKVLVEKLLRSCPDLDTLFLLMRAKKNEHILDRTDKLLADPVFQRLSKDQLAKVVPIAGDISLPELGLSQESRTMLVERVSVVFHSAATVRFADPVRQTLITNLRGANEMLKLCKEIRSLRTLVYVSTAYSNCLQKEISEKFYETPVTPEYVLNCVETMTDEQMEKIAPQLVGDWPNSYAFSKALAENLMKQGCGEVPVVIFRPSMVVSSVNEPLPGWNDNLNGPSGVVVGSAMGVVRCFHCNKNMKMDMVPVDLAINAMVASAWHTANVGRSTTVMNFTSSGRNPQTWNEFHHSLTKVGLEAPPVAALWYFMMITASNPTVYRILATLLHTLPALLLDFAALLMGKPRRMVRLYKKVEMHAKLSSYFALRQWEFSDTNVQGLIERMSPSDRERFPCDVASINWTTYMKTYYMGLRKYLLKDTELTVPEAIKRYNRLYLIHRAVQGGILLAVLGVVTKLISVTLNNLLA